MRDRVILAVRIRWLRFLCSFLFLSFNAEGCLSIERSFSQATITPNPEWRMVQRCGYEGCAKKVDFLVGRELTIRIEAHNDMPHAVQNRIFIIQVEFLSSSPQVFEYDPSQTTVQFHNGQIAKAKGLPCPGTIMDRSYILTSPPIIGLNRINKIDCFLLFFDAPPPSVNEVFTMSLANLQQSGIRIDVPEIVFRPGKQ